MRYRYKSKENLIIDTVDTLVLVFVLILCVLPLMNVVALSFSSKMAALSGRVSFLPVDFSLSAYEYLVQDVRFFQSFGVSVQRVLIGGFLNLFMCLTMGYALSKEKEEFPSRNRYMWLLIFTLLFNGGTVPWYFSVYYTGLIDSIWALVIPGAVPVFNVILLMNFFRNLPKPISEAARLDGASELQMMTQIFVPLAKPAIATITLFSLVGHWNNFFDGLVLINTSSKIPLQTYIQSLTIRTSSLTTMGMIAEDIAEHMSQRTFNAAKIVVSTVPILLIYPFMQRYFITGITLGSVKG